MKLENQVCTLEQARRLKELGISQDSICLWLDYSDTPHGSKIVWYDAIHFETDRSYIYSAFNVAEMGVMIPDDGEGAFEFFSAKDMGDYQGKDIAGFSVIRFEPAPSQATPEAVYPTEAQARAALLIHLLESGEVSAAQVNARLC